MASIKHEIEVFSANGSAFGHEQYKDGQPSGEYFFIREVDVSVHSPYGEQATITLTVDEAKAAVKILQEAIKKASKSDKKIIAMERKRQNDIERLLSNMRSGQSQEND